MGVESGDMIKILIVDDEKPICDLIDMNLSAAGYSCTAVQDGLEAIDAVENNTCLLYTSPSPRDRG